MCIAPNEASQTQRDFLKKWKFSAPKRWNSARLPPFLKLIMSKTKKFCETSFENGKFERASYQCVLRFLHSMCLKYCTCQEKVRPSHTKCCTCHVSCGRHNGFWSFIKGVGCLKKICKDACCVAGAGGQGANFLRRVACRSIGSSGLVKRCFVTLERPTSKKVVPTCGAFTILTSKRASRHKLRGTTAALHRPL